MSTNPKPSSSSASGNQNYDHPAHPKGVNVSLFNNAKNLRIKNSSLTVNVSGGSDPLQTLYDQVAQNAILNTGGRADEVRCYPGTREEIIGIMDRWMDGKDGLAPSMMWLSGPAGAGKSAIMQTMAERCKKRRIQAASFFFFRADRTRSTAQPLVATLLYQILDLYPPVRQAIAILLAKHPLVFGASLQDQFSQLLLPSLQGIPQPRESPARRRIVLLIDGLDECDSEKKTPQRQILQALDYLLTRDDCPFLVLVASRAEPHITMAIKELTSTIQSIFLDDQYHPERDIRRFVTGEFVRIKRSHHLAHTLGANWPSNGDIEAIVRKSSGQFIFAATVMRYIANSSASPKLSLQRVQSIAPVTTNSPFAHLDAVYRYILSQASDWDAVKDLFSIKLLSNYMNVRTYELSLNILRAYNPRYTPELLHSCASDLTAILVFNGNNIVFHHASLPDFLQDESRAEQYYIDVHKFGAQILPEFWIMVLESYDFKNRYKLFEIIPTSGPLVKMGGNLVVPFERLLLHVVHRLYYPHDIEAYKSIMRQSAFWYAYRLHKSAWRNMSGMTKSLPYLRRYYHICQMEYWVTNTLRVLRRQPVRHHRESSEREYESPSVYLS